MSLSPSLEIGGGYDSNILFRSSGGPRGYFNQTSARFDLDIRPWRRIVFTTDYEILYANYAAGIFSSLDNYLSAGLSVRVFEFLSIYVEGQWESFKPFNAPDYAFNRLSALPSIEAIVKGIVARGAVYASDLEFPERPPVSPAEFQHDKETDYLVLLGYSFASSMLISMTYVYSAIRSNFSFGTHHVLDSYGNAVVLNIWQKIRRRTRANLRLEAVSRKFIDNSPLLTAREDMGYKASIIFRHGFAENLEGFVSTSYLLNGSTNSNEDFKRLFVFAGVRVLFHPLNFERLWKEDL